MSEDWGHLIVWEFRAKAGIEQRFEQSYGPNGAWARFFATGEGYVRTELSRDLQVEGRYMTLDFWVSREAYEKFREANADRYHAIDAECEAMTESEVEIGSFERVTG